MNPYEKTAEEMKRQSEGPKRLAKGALAVGSAVAGATSFAPVLARAAPFLSQYIPENLAIKGLSKISPQFGAFIKSAMDGGYDFSQVKDFIGDQIKQSDQPKEDRNIIQQYDDKLFEALKMKIDKGFTPAQALSLVDIFPHHKKSIEKIEKAHKVPFLNIVEQIFGGPNQAKQSQQQEAMQPPGSMPQGAPSAEAQAFGGQPQQGQPQQGGQGQQALMAILQKINQTRGG